MGKEHLSQKKVENMDTLVQAGVKIQKYLLGIGFSVDMQKILSMLDVTFTHLKHGGNFDSARMELQVPVGDNPLSNHVKRHELGHAIGLNKKNSKTKRSGFESYNVHGYFDTSKQKVFVALNEAVVDELAYRSGGPNMLNWLSVNFGIYNRERKMLKMLCSGVAQSKKGLTSDDVFAEFVGVMLNGWGRQFKQTLINAFGPDILKVLAVIDVGNFWGEYDESLSDREMWGNLRIYLNFAYMLISNTLQGLFV